MLKQKGIRMLISQGIRGVKALMWETNSAPLPLLPLLFPVLPDLFTCFPSYLQHFSLIISLNSSLLGYLLLFSASQRVVYEVILDSTCQGQMFLH